MPNLFAALHVGLVISPGQTPEAGVRRVGPSGLAKLGEKVADPMTQHDIDEAIEAYGKAALAAKEIGFDGIELYGAHGYLIDQFSGQKPTSERIAMAEIS